ncbi:hypothetical protein T4D_13569 [Trichinella pseudospiralis]|uniref:Uncharacterized protein n=1 Tax=Trichinella pseudospiralis TaxID=6337 RepID=A0A0V1FBD0_TRIPS|nr:hypothetical protein T4D_13569 [Trichinella pseudospiralis]
MSYSIFIRAFSSTPMLISVLPGRGSIFTPRLFCVLIDRSYLCVISSTTIPSCHPIPTQPQLPNNEQFIITKIT